MRHSPLDAVHRALGAKMVPFGGWEMPLAYPTGTVEEHRACREGVAVFDASHLGTVRVSGPGAFGALQRALTNDLAKIEPGRAQYTHLLDEDDASVLDDIIVWWSRTTSSTSCPTPEHRRRAGALTPPPVTTSCRSRRRPALLAVQPRARVVRRGPPGVASSACSRSPTRVECPSPAPATPVRTASSAPSQWPSPSRLERAHLAGATPELDTIPCGSGGAARAASSAGITPLDAGLGWVVSWDGATSRPRGARAPPGEAGLERWVAREGAARLPASQCCATSRSAGSAQATSRPRSSAGCAAAATE